MDDTDDSGAVRLDPDGPHSPGYAAAVARTWRDAVRVLNHATLPGAGFPGLTGPQDVYTVLAALTTGAQGLAQLAFHLTEYLACELGAGRIGVNYGRYDGDPLAGRAEPGMVGHLRHSRPRPRHRLPRPG